MRSCLFTLAATTLAVFSPQDVSAFGIASPDTFHALHTAATTHMDASAATAAVGGGGFEGLLAAYKHSLATHPLPTKMMTGATLAVCGDAIAQAKDADVEYDKRRAASFAIFDMAYRALQHASFPIIIAACQGQYLSQVDVAHLFDASQWAALEQTLASQLGIVPFLYYPAFFALTGAVQGLDLPAAVQRAQENFIPLMKRNLLFWIPVQFVQFGYIQEDLQIPFLSVCGLAWTFILSVAAGSTKSYNSNSNTDQELQGSEVQDQSVLRLQEEQAAALLVEESSNAALANATSY